MFEIGLDGFVEVRTENTLCSQQTVRWTKLSNWSALVLLFHPWFCWQFITIKVDVWVWDPSTCQRDLFSFAFQISCQTLLTNQGNECEWDQPNVWSFVWKIRGFIIYLPKNKRGGEQKRPSENNWLLAAGSDLSDYILCHNIFSHTFFWLMRMERIALRKSEKNCQTLCKQTAADLLEHTQQHSKANFVTCRMPPGIDDGSCIRVYKNPPDWINNIFNYQSRIHWVWISLHI